MDAVPQDRDVPDPRAGEREEERVPHRVFTHLGDELHGGPGSRRRSGRPTRQPIRDGLGTGPPQMGAPNDDDHTISLAPWSRRRPP